MKPTLNYLNLLQANWLCYTLIFIGLTSLQAQEATNDYTFIQQPEISITGSAKDLVVDDFNGSGIPDILTTHAQNYNSLTPSSSNILTYVSLNNSTQNWETNIIENVGGYGSQAITSGDYNGDGNLDFAFSGYCNCSEYYLYLGNGSGGFTNETTLMGVRSTIDIKTTDFNNDGKEDIFSSGNAVFLQWLNNSTVNDIDLTKQGFSFSSLQTNNIYASRAIASGDINGDSWEDVVVGNTGDGNVTVFYNDGSGSFNLNNHDQYVIGSNGNSYGLHGVEVGDFNGDGHLDIVAISQELESVGILINDGNGSFEDVVLYTGVDSPDWVEVADMNTDGNLDVVVQKDSGFSILTGNGDGTFLDPFNSPTISNSRKLKIADINNDGLKDIVLLTLNSIKIFQQEGRLKDFSYTASSFKTDATEVTYTFNYSVQTPNPHYVIYVAQNSSCQTWDISNVQTEDVKVYVDGVPADIQFIDKSLNSGVSVKLSDTNIVQANSRIQVVIDNVNHTSQTNTCNWSWIQTATSGGNAIDEIENPEPITLANQGGYAQHKSLQFDGNNERASIANTTGINVGGSFTFETWLKYPEGINYSNEERLLLEYGAWEAGNIQLTSFENGGVKINFHGRDGDLPVVIDGLDDGNWHHIAGTFNASNGQVHYYIDGVIIASPGTLGNTPANISGLSLTLGARKNSNGSFIYHSNVSMDEVRIWNTARTGAEIYENYNIELEGDEPNLIAYFPMNEIINGYILDATSNNNDLQLFNMDDTNLIPGASLIDYKRNTWLGNTSNDANDWNNWSAKMNPKLTKSEFVIIPTIPGTTSNSIQDPKIYSLNTLEADQLLVETNRDLLVEGILKINSNLRNDGEITFKSNQNSTGQFDEFNGDYSGNGIENIERYISSNRSFRFLSSSVDADGNMYDNWQEGGNSPIGFGTHITGSTDGLNGLDATETGNPSLFDYNNVSQNWSVVSNTNVENLLAGKPYRLYVRGDRNIDLTNNDAENETTLRATGSLKLGNVLFDNLGETANNFNLIGNPYQAAVDMNSLTMNNINTSFYWVWDPNMNEDGAYVTVDLSDGSSAGSSQANQYLQPGQAAFVRTLAAGPASVTFTEASKNVNQVSNAIFSDNNEPRLNLRLYESQTLQNGGMEFDAIGIRFKSDDNNAVDSQDAPKMGNPAENLARLHGNDFLTIENRELPQDGEELSLALYNYEHVNYTFEADLSDFVENMTVYLNDNYTNSQTELVNGINHIDFTVDASIPESIAMTRFSISFENTTLSISDENFENFSVYPNPVTNQAFTIQTSHLTGEDVDLKLFNISGQAVMSQNLKVNSNGALNVQTSQLSSGVYILELTQGKQSYKEKLIIK